MSDEGVSVPKGVRFALEMLDLQLEDGSWCCMSSVGGKTYEGHGATHHEAYCDLRAEIAKGVRR